MKYIASCSFGKDSLAQIILAHEHNEPIDYVVYRKSHIKEIKKKLFLGEKIDE